MGAPNIVSVAHKDEAHRQLDDRADQHGNNGKPLLFMCLEHRIGDGKHTDEENGKGQKRKEGRRPIGRRFVKEQTEYGLG